MKKNADYFSYSRAPEIVRPLLDWYAGNARVLPWRDNPTPYRVWISEIMSQQTRVDTVKPYFERFVKALPSIRHLAEAPEDQLMKLWEGLGYYRRVQNLQKAARIILEKYQGEFPADPEAIAELPGIGAYTTGSISSIAFGIPEPAVDGNVLRVLTRLAECRTSLAESRLKDAVADVLRKIYPFGKASEFTQSLMELGAMICLPGAQAQCLLCPLSFCCGACKSGTAADFPVKEEKKIRRKENMTVFLLRTQNGRLAIRKRAAAGLLAGLWELPHVAGFLTEAEIQQLMKQWDLNVLSLRKGRKTKHVFTHREWHMQPWEIQCIIPEKPETRLLWINYEDLVHEYALPTAFRKAFSCFPDS